MAAPAAVDPAWVAGVGESLVQRSTTTDARLRNVRGVVVIRFRVAPDGKVVGVWVLHGSGNRALDQAALALVRGTRVPPFPPDMGEAPRMVTLPIRYDLQ
jgi:protein TonB